MSWRVFQEGILVPSVKNLKKFRLVGGGFMEESGVGEDGVWDE